MPYPGVPKELTQKMEQCVERVMGQGHEKGEAIAICKTSITKRKSLMIPRDGMIYNMVFDEPFRVVDASRARFRIYGVLFGDEDHRDLYGTYFDARTKYHLGWYKTLPWLHHHGMNPTLRAEGLQKVGDWDTFGQDEVGVFLEGELNLRHKYVDALLELAQAGVLYPSSGTLEYAAAINRNGHVDEWPIVEVSSTVSPAEWRMEAMTPEVVRAYRALSQLEYTPGGTITMAGLGDRIRELLGRRDVSDEVQEETSEEEETVVTEDVETETGTEEEVETGVEPPADRSVDVDALIRAVQALDHRVQEYIERADAELRDVQELVVRLAQSETERARSAMNDPQWYKSLFSVTQRTTQTPGPDVSEEEAAALRTANNRPLQDQGGDGNGIFGAMRQQ